MGVNVSAASEVPEISTTADGLPIDLAPEAPLLEIAVAEQPLVDRLAAELALHPLAAELLVRRGFTDPDAARALTTAVAAHEPALLPGAIAGAEVIRGHVERGSRIAVHGDYDVDGVCSTAILVRALAGLGAEVTWHVPSRFEDGYGLTTGSIDRLAVDGVDLIVAVDCGISSVGEVAHACSLGIEVVVCDHHTIGEPLPDATIVHPGLGEYPDPYLCAAAATHKLATLVVELAGGDVEAVARDGELVALATVCDVVPLVGENRALVRGGLELLRRTQRPGLRELMRVAGVDQLALQAGALGFALGPRINAAGRMGSAEPAVELLLTVNEARAAELAGQLASANRLRKEIEQEVLTQAETQAARQRDRFAIVVAGEGWHPGVLGIVAGRLAERYRRPVVVLGIDGDVASGSGRAGGGFDLHGGLARCAGLLDRFGGHRAAAGLQLPADRIEQFRRDFAVAAEQELSLDDLRPRLVVDAIAKPSDINLEVVAQLDALGPWGASNPTPRLLLQGVRLDAVSKLGKTGNHFKLAVSSSGARASVVAFRQDRAIPAAQLPRPVDLVVELQRNEFNGREEAQAVMRAIVDRNADEQQQWRSEFDQALMKELAPAAGSELGERPLTREHMIVAYRLVRDNSTQLDALLGCLAADLPSGRVAGLALRSLAEIEVIAVERSGDLVDGFHVREGGGALDQSPTFRAYSESRE